ncbi:sphingomyelin phosphodiesterase 4 isoform X1 [Amblyomma americanum]
MRYVSAMPPLPAGFDGKLSMVLRNAFNLFSFSPQSPLPYQQYQGCLVTALDTYPLEKRCHELNHLFQELPLKELQHYLPTVLEHVFGFGTNLGWGLQCVQHGQQGFDTIRYFLGPEGPLLRLVYRLLSDAGLKYDFPVSCLPSDARRSLSSGPVPPFWAAKIPSYPVTGVGSQGPTALQLNAFELYMFHFAYLVVNPSQSGTLNQQLLMDVAGGEGQRANSRTMECLYVALLQDYLHYFLPFMHNHPPALDGYHPHQSAFAGTSAPSSLCRDAGSSFWNGSLSLPNSGSLGYYGSPGGLPRHQLSLFRKDVVDDLLGSSRSGGALTGAASPAVGSPAVMGGHSGSNPYVRVSEAFLEILLQFWLGRQQAAPAGLSMPSSTLTSTAYGMSPSATAGSTSFHHSFSSMAEESYMRSDFHMLIVRVVVKYLHQFRYSIPDTSSKNGGALYQCNHHHPLDDIKMMVPQLLRKRLYEFLKQALTHWPLDNSFRLPLETWLSFIQPWRYAPAYQSKPAGGRQEAHNQEIEAQWQPFVQEHLLFYTELLGMLLPRLCRMELASRRNAFMLFRVAKVFSQRNLYSMIKEAETSLTSGAGQSPSPTTGLRRQAVGATVANLVKQHMADVEEPGFVHRPLTGDDRRKQLVQLVQLALQAQRVVRWQLQGSGQEVDLTDSGGTQQRRDQRPPGAATSWWGRLKGSLRSALSSLMPSGVPDEVAERKKTLLYLRASVDELCGTFRLENIPDPSSATVPAELMREPSSALSHDITDFPGKGYGMHRVTDFSGRAYDTQDVTDFPGRVYDTQRSICGVNAFGYHGNPDTEPIRSYEVVFLVRILHLLSSAFNAKYGHELQLLYESPHFVGYVARQLLRPPTVYTETIKTGVGRPYVRHEHTLHARLCLRPLAHRQVLGYLACLFFLGYTWNVGPIAVSFMVLLCFSLAVLIRAAWSWGLRRASHSHQASN